MSVSMTRLGAILPATGKALFIADGSSNQLPTIRGMAGREIAAGNIV